MGLSPLPEILLVEVHPGTSLERHVTNFRVLRLWQLHATAGSEVVERPAVRRGLHVVADLEDRALDQLLGLDLHPVQRALERVEPARPAVLHSGAQSHAYGTVGRRLEGQPLELDGLDRLGVLLCSFDVIAELAHCLVPFHVSFG